MKITKLVPLFQSEYDYTAEINLTKKQLEFITNVGLGVLLQAGSTVVMFDKDVPEAVFEDEKENKKDEKTVIEGTSETIIPQPAQE